MPDPTVGPQFDSPTFRRCDDPECSAEWMNRPPGSPSWHYHYTGNEPQSDSYRAEYVPHYWRGRLPLSVCSDPTPQPGDTVEWWWQWTGCDGSHHSSTDNPGMTCHQRGACIVHDPPDAVLDMVTAIAGDGR